MKLREAAEMKCYAAHLEQEGFQELELAMIDTWCQPGSRRAGRLAPPSPSAPSPPVEGQWAPSPLGPVPKTGCHVPNATTSGALREEVTLQEVSLPMGSCEAIASSSGSSQPPAVLQGSPVTCHIPQLTLPTRSFKQVNLKGSSKLYLCKQCEKQTSKWDSMVYHCLQ